MSDFEEGRSMVLEGMYRGVASKIDELRDAMRKELQFGSAQEVSAYESLTESLKQGIESLLAELRYISEQNSSIYEYDEFAQQAMKEAILGEVRATAEQSDKHCTEQLAVATQEMNRSFDEKIAALKAELLEAIKGRPAPEKAPEEEPVKAEEAPEEEAEIEEEVAPAEPAEEVEGDGFDYDLLAEKISTILPETDYDTVVERVVAAIPQVDSDAVAEKVIAALPQDDNALAERLAESVAPIDYDLIAEKVTSALEQHDFDAVVDEEGADKIAQKTVEKIDYDLLARKIAGLIKLSPVVVAAAPVSEPEPVEPEVIEAEPAVEPEYEEEYALAASPVVIAAPTNDEEVEMTTRYKRSFEAKIIQSDEETKQRYSDLKNALLAYNKVRSQVSWSNDRYTISRETIAKIGIRGKTLCVYLALNPDEFPASVYHQKYAGDVKMYEKTPLMIKISSGVAVKRAIKLIDLLMEKYGAVGGENEPVDYVKLYAWRSDEELMSEGYIKTSMMEKSDLDF